MAPAAIAKVNSSVLVGFQAYCKVYEILAASHQIYLASIASHDSHHICCQRLEELLRRSVAAKNTMQALLYKTHDQILSDVTKGRQYDDVAID